jgi:hypothetical protein
MCCAISKELVAAGEGAVRLAGRAAARLPTNMPAPRLAGRSPVPLVPCRTVQPALKIRSARVRLTCP